MIAWTNKYYSMVRTSWTIMTSFKLFLFFVCIFVCLFCCFFCLVVCFSIVYAFVYFKCTIKAKYRLSFTRRTVKKHSFEIAAFRLHYWTLIFYNNIATNSQNIWIYIYRISTYYWTHIFIYKPHFVFINELTHIIYSLYSSFRLYYLQYNLITLLSLNIYKHIIYIFVLLYTPSNAIVRSLDWICIAGFVPRPSPK